MTSSNPVLRETIVMLERAGRKGHPVWRDASEALRSEGKNRVEVNVGRISRVASEAGAVFVPGKVLGTGKMEHKAIVGAFSFSAAARSKIKGAGGLALSIDEFVKKYPSGERVKLVK